MKIEFKAELTSEEFIELLKRLKNGDLGDLNIEETKPLFSEEVADIVKSAEPISPPTLSEIEKDQKREDSKHSDRKGNKLINGDDVFITLDTDCPTNKEAEFDKWDETKRGEVGRFLQATSEAHCIVDFANMGRTSLPLNWIERAITIPDELQKA